MYLGTTRMFLCFLVLAGSFLLVHGQEEQESSEREGYDLSLLTLECLADRDMCAVCNSFLTLLNETTLNDFKVPKINSGTIVRMMCGSIITKEGSECFGNVMMYIQDGIERALKTENFCGHLGLCPRH